MQAVLLCERKVLSPFLLSISTILAARFGVATHYCGSSEDATDVGCAETQTIDTAGCLSYRIEKLQRHEPVLSAFKGWMGDGFPVHRGDIFHAINRLRKLKMNKRALEVMEWIVREKPYKLNELDYSYLLEFTSKLHGIEQGEKLFTRVPVEFQNTLLYNNLVLSCLDKSAIRLGMDYMKKMRALSFPISPLVYNRLIILHSSPGRRKTIPKIMAQMKADGVIASSSTYNILLKLEASEHNIEGVMKVFNDMKQANVEPSEVTYCILATAHAVARLYAVCEAYIEAVEASKTGTNWSTFDVLMILYGYVGKEKEIERTWKIIESHQHIRTKSFILAIEAFGRIGHINRAEELWLEMKTKKDLKFTEQFNAMISVYTRYGLVDKASELFKEMLSSNCKPNAITYRHLALGCLRSGLVEEALKTLVMACDHNSTKEVSRSTPWLETTLSIIEVLAATGDVGNTMKLFRELKEARYSRYTFVHNTLLRSYVKAKTYAPDFLRKMILGGARPDDETYSLLRLMEQFKT
ncbi:pentatricopeptide repeat-containing protein At1g07590, mitochondrial [Nymphaea colorata]|nr:pentatricopeptide repeat-containing protein At1g07590, mitochondrial [Nymphaea colorata]